MAYIGNRSFESFKIILLIMVVLNLFCYAHSTNNDNSLIRRNIKGRLGTHWNRIGKRSQFNQQQEQSQELQDSQEPSLQPSNELCNDLLLLKHLAEKYEIWMKLEQFIGKIL